MTLLENLAESLLLDAVARNIDIHPDRPLVYQFATQDSGKGNQHASEQREIQTPRPDQIAGVIEPKQPVERCEREQHYRESRMAPGSNQPANTRHGDQIDQADSAGNPAAECTCTGEPEAGARPEEILAQQVGDIRRYQPDQGGDREVNQHRVDRVSAKRHFAHDRLMRFANNRFMHLAYLPVIALLFPLLAGCSGPLSTLDPAGPSARSAALLWWGMFVFSTLVLIVIVALWLHAMRRPEDMRDEVQQQRTHTRWIIGGGVILPSVSIFVLLLFGIPMGHRMLPLPPAAGEALQINVTGHQWWWEVHYPQANISLKNELYIPVDVPIDVHLATADVIHGFWVPRLGGKLDAIPGRTNILRLQADEPGVYPGQCAEFCGLHHAVMRFRVTAQSAEDFSRWLEANRND